MGCIARISFKLNILAHKKLQTICKRMILQMNDKMEWG